MTTKEEEISWVLHLHGMLKEAVAIARYVMSKLGVDVHELLPMRHDRCLRLLILARAPS
jgi:hypothetical protein